MSADEKKLKEYQERLMRAQADLKQITDDYDDWTYGRANTRNRNLTDQCRDPEQEILLIIGHRYDIVRRYTREYNELSNKLTLSSAYEYLKKLPQ
jgi:hypothetical protein